jgi:hypothetical protein
MVAIADLPSFELSDAEYTLSPQKLQELLWHSSIYTFISADCVHVILLLYLETSNYLSVLCVRYWLGGTMSKKYNPPVMSSSSNTNSGSRLSDLQKLAWIIVLICLIIGILLFAPSVGHFVNSLSTTNSGNCTSQGFDYKTEAQSLASDLQAYRSAHPFRGNYGNASIVVCYADGTFWRNQSLSYQGTGNPQNDNHSEKLAFAWLQQQVIQLPTNKTLTNARAYTLVFSQVRVCDACKTEMTNWLSDLRTLSGNPTLALAIWQIKPGSGSGFDPARKPAGIPLDLNDVKQVQVGFTP